MPTPESPLSQGEFAAPEQTLTQEDRIRMQTLQAGDEVSDYVGFPDIQRDIIMRERASTEVDMSSVALDGIDTHLQKSAR